MILKKNMFYILTSSQYHCCTVNGKIEKYLGLSGNTKKES